MKLWQVYSPAGKPIGLPEAHRDDAVRVARWWAEEEVTLTYTWRELYRLGWRVKKVEA